MSSWKRDRFGEIVEEQDTQPPAAPVKPERQRWEVTASWRGRDGLQEGTVARVGDREELKRIVAELRVKHGGQDGFQVDVDEFDGQSRRRSLTNHGDWPSVEQNRAHVARARAALHRELPVETEVF